MVEKEGAVDWVDTTRLAVSCLINVGRRGRGMALGGGHSTVIAQRHEAPSFFPICFYFWQEGVVDAAAGREAKRTR